MAITRKVDVEVIDSEIDDRYQIHLFMMPDRSSVTLSPEEAYAFAGQIQEQVEAALTMKVTDERAESTAALLSDIDYGIDSITINGNERAL